MYDIHIQQTRPPWSSRLKHRNWPCLCRKDNNFVDYSYLTIYLISYIAYLIIQFDSLVRRDHRVRGARRQNWPCLWGHTTTMLLTYSHLTNYLYLGPSRMKYAKSTDSSDVIIAFEVLKLTLPVKKGNTVSSCILSTRAHTHRELIRECGGYVDLLASS